MAAGTIRTLAAVQAQALVLAALFVLAGRTALDRFLQPPDAARQRPLVARCGDGFFVGVALFQGLFVIGSLVTQSARIALWLGLAILVVLAVAGVRTKSARQASTAAIVATILGLLGLVALFTLTNAACWFEWNGHGPSPTPALMTHFGSIHTGRYANYAIAIDDLNRIPHIAQNLGQSLLAAIHLLVGTRAPLAALAVWIPLALAALTAQIYGCLRELGIAPGWSAWGTFLVLSCNVAISAVSVFLLDNGFPLGVIGYTDAVCSLGTFLIFASLLVELVAHARALPLRGGPIALLFGLFWAWSAPQNVVLAPLVTVALAIIWGRRHGEVRTLLRRLAPVVLALAAGVVLGASQLGALLPTALAEDVGVRVISPGTQLRFRPYVCYLTEHWSHRKWVGVSAPPGIYGSPRLYDRVWWEARSNGLAAAMAAVLQVFIEELWESVRLYVVLPLGALLLRQRAHHVETSAETSMMLESWSAIALLTFAIGYAVFFFLELSDMKWWLSRFLLPGTLLGLLSFVAAILPGTDSPSPRHAWRFWLPALLSLPSLLELGLAFDANWSRASAIDPLPHRLELLAFSRGPFGE